MKLSVHIKKRLGAFTLQADLETWGGTLGLLGASGSGKSLTLNCIAGLQRPDEGSIVLDGETLFDAKREINLPPQRRRVGYLFQSYALFPHMTVAQNIRTGLNWQRDRAEREREVGRMLALFQLEQVANARPKTLSGGEAQRTALARMLVNRPRLLLLDEPFSALDSHLKGRLQMELKDLLAEWGTDAVLVTHSRDEAYHLCSHVAIVEQGRLSGCRETKALFDDPGSVAAARLTGCKNIAPARKTGAQQVQIPQWGLTLQTNRPVKDNLVAVGIRAHSFADPPGDNSFPVCYTGEMEEPFGWILSFRTPGQSPDSPDLWRRLAKTTQQPPKPERLCVRGEDILLLYE